LSRHVRYAGHDGRQRRELYQLGSKICVATRHRTRQVRSGGTRRSDSGRHPVGDKGDLRGADGPTVGVADGCERVAVERGGAVLAEGLEGVGGGIAFVTSETVLGVNGVPFFHAGITMRFGEDGSSSDGDAFAVALDERFLLNEDIQLDGV